MTEKEILDLIDGIKIPNTDKNISHIAKVEGVSKTDGLLKIRLMVPDLQVHEKKEVRSLIEEEFTKNGIDVLVSITTSSSIQAKPESSSHIKPFLPEEVLSRFKKTIAIYSTKGGVGKSTVAANLALELAEKGLKIAIVDLDIYGPSIPRLLGMKGSLVTHEQKFVPAEIDGIHMMSVGLLVPALDSPLVWRAPIVNGVIAQIFSDTMWDNEYDVLVLDMPPGTGDIPITVGQSIPLDGVLAISTPQGVALEDTVKGLSMFKKFNIPLLGFVYNMGTIVCDGCKKSIPLFKRSSEFDEYLMDYNVDIISELPLDPRVTELADKGELSNVSEDWLWKKEFNKITDHVTSQLGIIQK